LAGLANSVLLRRPSRLFARALVLPFFMSASAFHIAKLLSLIFGFWHHWSRFYQFNLMLTFRANG
jgi:hypothetical protein